jgi:hypothetical protein
MKSPSVAALAVVVTAAAAAVVPLPHAGIERLYSTGAYPVLQRSITALSNRIPFALIDVLLLSAIVGWLAAAAIEVRRALRLEPARAAWRLAVRTVVTAAVLYLGFLALWGFNYRRLPLEEKLVFDKQAVTPQAARALAATAVSRVNGLHERAYASGWPDDSVVESSLAKAFSSVERDLGAPGTTVPGRPKLTLLDWYFRPAAVAGMTDPFFLETLVVSDLLPFERPFVVAHEWSHLAGFADEGEANFVGWLTCVHGTAPAQYSGWLFLYGELASALPRRDQADVAARLADGPREDLRRAAARLARDVSPKVSAAGWRVYDRYLKANRVDAGAASYAQVVTLALGTRLDAALRPTVVPRALR